MDNGKKNNLPATKYSTFWLTTTAVTLLDGIARKQGLRRAAVLENMIREKAKAEGVGEAR